MTDNFTSISIDGQPLRVEKGSTILQAARQNGIAIPTLCDFPGLPPHGSCRMCIVEVQGRPTTPTACTTPVEEGMVIQTASAKVQALRRELLQMLLAEHPCACLVCPEKDHCEECMVTLRKAGVTTGCRSCARDGQCELQQLATNIGINGVDYPIRYRMLPVEKYDPFFDRDYNLCVLCARCIRVCEDLHFANALAYTSRGTHTLVGTAFHRTHFNATCSFCGACVEVCPTGALSEKTRKWDGKPEREVNSICPLCSIGCPVKLVIKNDRVIGSLPGDGTGALGPLRSVCVKGRFGITELVNHPTRLRRPQKQSGAERLEISWDEAARIAVETLAACTPGRFGLLISTGSTNEDLYVAQKFTREVMHSENIYTTAQARYSTGLEALFRLLQKSQPLDILADPHSHNTPILCLGLDGRYAQSVVEVQLHRVKTGGSGAAGKPCAKLLTINAQPHVISDYADEWLKPASGEETELIQQLAELTGSTPTPEDAGMPASGAQLERVAQLLRDALRACHAPESSRPIIILGPAFLAHPDNTRLLAAVERLAENCRAQVIVLAEQGNLAGSLLLVSQAAAQADAQDLDVLYLIGAAVPEEVPEHTRILYQNIYPPSGEHPVDLLLPAAAFSEADGTLIDYAGRVRSFRPAVPAPGDALPTWEILCRIARQMGAPGFNYTSASEIQAEMAGLLPDGRVDWEQAPLENAPRPVSQSLPIALQVGEHDYMGFPLSHWVEGLRMIYPEE